MFLKYKESYERLKIFLKLSENLSELEKKVTKEEILENLRLKLLKQKFLEKCGKNNSEAISVLENEIFPLLNKNFRENEKEYLSLCLLLAKNTNFSDDKIYDQRFALFQDIINYFPEKIVEPKNDLHESGLKI